MDVGHDVGGHVDGHVDGVEPGIGHSVLHFFYIGEVPTMLLVSVMVLSLWAFSMLGNHYLNPEGSVAMAVAIFFGNFAISTLVLKFVALPLRTFYFILNKDYNAPGDVVGKVCRVVTTHVTREKMGQAEVPTKGAPIAAQRPGPGRARVQSRRTGPRCRERRCQGNVSNSPCGVGELTCLRMR